MLSNKTPPHLITLVLLASTAPLAMNIILPSLPALSREFGADKSVTQLAITFYLITTAVLQPIIGPASDFYGRRPVVLFGLIGLFLGTLICIFSTSIEMLLIGRVVQAIAATGLVISRAIVRDVVDSEAKAATMIAYVTMGMALSPMVAPFMGGWLDQHYGWQASLWLLLGISTVFSLLVFFDLGETRKVAAPSLFGQFKTYPELLRSRRFIANSLSAACASGGFFAFLGGGPYISDEFFHLTPSQFGLYFSAMPIGYFIGNFISGRFTTRVGTVNMMLAGNVIIIIAMAAAIFWLLLGSTNPISMFLPISFVGIGNGMTLPSANAGVVSARPQFAGAASGLGGFLQVILGAGVSAFAGFMLAENSYPLPLYVIIGLTAVAGVAASMYVRFVNLSLVENPVASEAQ